MAELDIELNDLGMVGVVNDMPAHMLPPEVWTLAHNMRYIDGEPTRILGQSPTLGSPPVAPHFLLPVRLPTVNWWVYTSLTKAYAYNGVSHSDITRTSGGDYTTTTTREWNGTLLGGIPILNNGIDVPQYWSAISGATPLAALPNWTATWRAKVIRAFGPYLVALHVTKASGLFQHMVKWSHPADPGTVPASWDETDPTKDAGERELPDVESGYIVDGLPMRGIFYIYKESAVWAMRPIGGQFIFAFDTLSDVAGLLTERCMINISTRNLQTFVSQEDWLIHDGVTVRSIIDRKMRRTLFNEIDATNYRNCFIFHNHLFNEAWFCYPTAGREHPDKALIWNYNAGNGSGAFSTADVNFRNVAVGTVDDSDTLTWAGAADGWPADEVVWDAGGRRKLVACLPADTEFNLLEDTTQRDGQDYTATLQRTGLSLIGRKRDGSWIVDVKRVKTVRRVWIKCSGGPINVRLGASMSSGVSIVWGTSQTFDPATQEYIDVTLTGRFIAIEFETTDANGWRLAGYKIEVTLGGNF